MGYQARHIQEYLNVPKIRYEYIQKKCEIKPEEEAESKGGRHTFNFKNFIQFVWAHSANRMGLAPAEVRELLDRLNEFENDTGFGLFKQAPIQDVKMYFLYYGNSRTFLITTDGAWRMYPSGLAPVKILQEAIMGCNALGTAIDLHISRWAKDARGSAQEAINPKSFKSLLANADGYLIINLDALKNKLVAENP